jgi:hypothetical protein
MKALCVLIFAISLGGPASAQTAILRGQVTDESGAVIPGANITITAGQTTKTTTADSRGAYTFAGLAAGDYLVSASAPQLSMAKPTSISLKPGDQTLNLQLKVAVTTQQVTVKENAAPALSTDAASNASGAILRGADLDALSDDPDDLMADLLALAGPSAGPNGGSIFIDGFSGGEIPPKSSIREIRINQNPFSAEYDKLGYGRIEIFTKPGTERYHAQVDYNFGDSFWNSRNPYSAQKAPLLLNELEGNVGGPLNKRTSFTLDFQRNAVNNGAIFNGVLVDPKTFAVGPSTSILEIPQRFLRLTPRIDYQLNENNTLVMRYSITRSHIDGVGIGGYDLPSRGYYFAYTNQTFQLTETAVLGTTINESRFQYFRAAPQRIADTDAPTLMVLGAFNDGGASVGRSFDTQNYYELSNVTTTVHGAHAWKYGARLRDETDDNVSPQNFNGTYTFGGGLAPMLDSNNQPVLDASGEPVLVDITSSERYRRTLLFQQLGVSPAEIRLLGGGATQFSINTGNPELYVNQFDLGVFVADDWRIRPNLTLSLGLRYEMQTNIHDWRDIAPRIGIAWAPAGAGASSRPKTVLRAGFGTFYDRFALSNTLTADRYNGIVQQEFIVPNPDFFPMIPSLSSLAAFQSNQAIQEVSSTLRAPYILQSAFTLERQLPGNTTLALTYTNSRGVHELRSEDINAPLPVSGAFPLGRPGPVFLMESSGIYNQNQLIANVNARVNASLSAFGFYVLNKAMSNTDGLGTFPANPYNFAGEYGPAATDVRNRVTLGGSINTRWAVRVSPYVNVQSGPPFDITDGGDPYGTTLFNARPGIATDSSRPGVIDTKYGLLDPNPTPQEVLLGRNAGRGPGQISMNLRVAKTFGFGPQKGEEKKSGAPASNGGMASASAATGRGLGSVIGVPSSDRRYNLIVSMSIRNLLNHTNPGPINGNITSPLFGQANQMAGGLNGEGFSENANNRRLELQLRFTF